ncbi:glycosyltransferase 87 family protein [Lentzea sp. BCCO 10_0061]|uniref:Glycosyltransferase 87 family protein n=1 Tax=Lentzea sokolovensis TaxID=3095429 RepID=A0ABU4UP43_9PSEU|nr:glycosyltransferase 87 family protein [Lentzea sp. BCCO 10_0061]MDX8141201.1 glycosyltransferase 87 family protein [Lentzea sp. BCCO 10_0061]
MLLIRGLADEVPPMSAGAFESGRRRLLTRHRWVAARKVVRVLWFVALSALPISLMGMGFYFLDLQVYRTGGVAWLQGQALYVGFPGSLDGPRLPFTYPPIAAVLFSGLTFLPVWAANSLVVVVNFLCLSVVSVLVTARLTQRSNVVWTVGPAVAILAVALEPVISTLLFGQINLLLMALVVVDCLAVRDPRFRGLLVGVAAAIKLTPLIFLLYFLVRREWRAAAMSTAAFAGLAVLGFLFAAKDSAEFWFHALLDPSRAGGLAYMANQSLRGVLHRINPGEHAESLLWLGLSLIVVALAVVAAHGARHEVAALTAIATAGLLVSPVSWSHHWVWCVPAFLALGFARRSWAWPTLGALLVIFLVQPFTWLPSTGDKEMLWSWQEHVYGDAYTWVAIIGLVAAAITATRRELSSASRAPRRGWIPRSRR